MKIRSKLSWTFILLLIFGITAISSYAILFIRDYLLDQGVEEIEKDARWMAVTIQNLNAGQNFDQHLELVGKTTNYQLALFDSAGNRFTYFPASNRKHAPAVLTPGILGHLDRSSMSSYVINRADSEKIFAYVFMPQSLNAAHFIQVSQYKEQIYHPIKTIRWIIYYGMFLSIGLVIVVSIWISRYMTKPIEQIKDAALEIAEGDVDRQIDLNRNDEFGTLAQSLNRMASRLRADNEQLKSINERQRQFFADISHEIRNPLHTMMGSLEMLEIDALDRAKRSKYLNTTRKQAERLNRLFKDLLTLQRYDSDEYFIEKQTFDLAGISRHMQDLYGDVAAEKGIDLNIDTHPCTVIGDPGKIEQVIDNLVSNAIKYTNSGRVELRYKQEGGAVKLRVSDTGIGISEEHLGRLFDRFYRTDKARSRDKGGTGLGLAVVRSILDAHGTDIKVESAVGEGTRFTFTLPAV